MIILKPNCNFIKCWFQFEYKSSNMFSITKLFTKISQKQIFPELWCMLLLGFDFKLTSLQKCCILPNWSDSFFETMQKGAIWHCSWSSQMLINHPKVLNLYHWQIKIWIQNSVFYTYCVYCFDLHKFIFIKSLIFLCFESLFLNIDPKSMRILQLCFLNFTHIIFRFKYMSRCIW